MKNNNVVNSSLEINDLVKLLIVCLLILYSILGVPNLNSNMLRNFDTIYVRIILICLIIITAVYDPIICLLLAICFVLTHHKLQELKKQETNNMIENIQNTLRNNETNYSEEYNTNEEPNLNLNEINNELLNEEPNNELMNENQNLNLNENSNELLNEEPNNDISHINKNDKNNGLGYVLLPSNNNLNNQDLIDISFNYIDPKDVNKAVMDTNKYFYSEEVFSAMSENMVPNASQNNELQSKINGMSAQGFL